MSSRSLRIVCSNSSYNETLSQVSIEAITLTFSFVGFVSSNRMMSLPLYALAKYWFSMAALACPIWRYPLGSGGNRVTTAPMCAFGKSRTNPVEVLSAVYADVRLYCIHIETSRTAFFCLAVLTEATTCCGSGKLSR